MDAIYGQYSKYNIVIMSINKFQAIESCKPNKILFYRSKFLLLLLLLLCLKSEIMDRFWSSGCLNDRIDMPVKIGSFLSGATTPMVVKNGTKKII